MSPPISKTKGQPSSVKAKQEMPPPSINQVFQQDELREAILGYAIRKNSGSVCYPMVRSIRRVQKSWLRTTSKLLKKERDPLFILELNSENSVSGTPYVEENGKLLNHFINSATSDSRLDNCVPSFRLKIREDFFRKENHQSLSDLLVKCGGGLVGLELFVPWKGGSLTSLFPRVNLPILKKLTVNLTEIKLKKFASGEVVCPHNSNITHLIQYLLNASEALTDFTFPFQIESNGLFGFDFLSLPSTLTKLVLKCNPRNSELEMLARSTLPSLTSLTLRVQDDVPFADGLVYRVLDNFRSTLLKIIIFGTFYSVPSRETTLFRFPVMEKLESFYTSSTSLELEPESSSLAKYLPKLASLTLSHQTVGMIQKWTENSKLSTVTYLQLQFVNDNVRQNDRNYSASLDLATMQKIHLTFCNLRQLELNVSVSRTCGLKYMFMEMRQLTYLKIIVSGSTPEMNSDICDALLIGVSNGLIAALRENPEDWEVVGIEKSNRPSIRMLAALTTFSLETRCPLFSPSDTFQPLISDFAFHHAFLKMARLKKLYFHGRFKASDEMSQLWRSWRRTLVYTP